MLIGQNNIPVKEECSIQIAQTWLADLGSSEIEFKIFVFAYSRKKADRGDIMHRPQVAHASVFSKIIAFQEIVVFPVVDIVFYVLSY